MWLRLPAVPRLAAVSVSAAISFVLIICSLRMVATAAAITCLLEVTLSVISAVAALPLVSSTVTPVVVPTFARATPIKGSAVS